MRETILRATLKTLVTYANGDAKENANGNANEKCAAYLYQTNDTSNGVYSDNSPTYSQFLGYLIG